MLTWLNFSLSDVVTFILNSKYSSVYANLKIKHRWHFNPFLEGDNYSPWELLVPFIGSLIQSYFCLPLVNTVCFKESSGTFYKLLYLSSLKRIFCKRNLQQETNLLGLLNWEGRQNGTACAFSRMNAQQTGIFKKL